DDKLETVLHPLLRLGTRGVVPFTAEERRQERRFGADEDARLFLILHEQIRLQQHLRGRIGEGGAGLYVDFVVEIAAGNRRSGKVERGKGLFQIQEPEVWLRRAGRIDARNQRHRTIANRAEEVLG